MIGSRRKHHQAAIKAASAGTPPNQAVMENLSSRILGIIMHAYERS